MLLKVKSSLIIIIPATVFHGIACCVASTSSVVKMASVLKLKDFQNNCMSEQKASFHQKFVIFIVAAILGAIFIKILFF